MDAPDLRQLAHAYQRTLRHFGLTPVQYTPHLAHVLTQLPTDDYCHSSNSSSDDDDDDDDDHHNNSKADAPPPHHNLVSVHQHVQVSRTFLRALAPDAASQQQQPIQPPPAVWKEQQQVLQANEQALLNIVVVQQQRQRDHPKTSPDMRPPSPLDTLLVEEEPPLAQASDDEELDEDDPSRLPTARFGTRQPSTTTISHTGSKTSATTHEHPVKLEDSKRSTSLARSDENDVLLPTNDALPTGEQSSVNHHALPEETTNGSNVREDSPTRTESPALGPPDDARNNDPSLRHHNHESSSTAADDKGNGSSPTVSLCVPEPTVGPKRRRVSDAPPRARSESSTTTTATTPNPTTAATDVPLVTTEQPRRRHVERSEPTHATTTTPPPSTTLDTPNNNNMAGAPNEHKNNSTTSFAVGSIVQVQPRTWPGINKPGGVAKVTAVHHHKNNDYYTYDVAFVLGGTEKAVEAVFVSPYSLVDDDRRQTNNRIPAPLLQQLAAEGFDVKGTTTWKQSSKRREQQQTKSAQPSRKRRIESTRPPSKKHKKTPARQVEPTSSKNESSANVVPNWSTIQEMCTLADHFYQRRIQQAMDQGVVYVVASALGEEDMSQLRRLAKKKLKMTSKGSCVIKIAETFSANKTTLCVMPTRTSDENNNDNANTALTRTMKSMQAALAGVPIVSFSAWIAACFSQQQIAMPDSYIRTLPSLSGNSTDYGVAYVAAAHASRQQHFCPLDQWHVWLCGMSSSSSRRKHSDAVSLLRLAGATILTRPSAALTQLKKKRPSKVAIVCDGGPIPRALRQLPKFDDDDGNTLLVVNLAWVFDSVSRGLALPADDYCPDKSASAKALWKLCTR